VDGFTVRPEIIMPILSSDNIDGQKDKEREIEGGRE
jgi:hypothetical protein